MRKKVFMTLIATLIVSVFGLLSYRFYLEKQFQSEFNNVEMNTKLKFLKPDPAWNSFKVEDGIHLEFVNASAESIRWDFRTDIVIVHFDITTLRWQQIANQVTYVPIDGENNKIMPPMNSSAPPVFIWIQPSLGTWLGLQPFRVVVIGEVLNDGMPSGKRIGAYIDVTLHR